MAAPTDSPPHTSPPATAPTPLHACTIVSKNYLPFARVLARSFRRAMPEGRFFVLLVDRVDGFFDPADEPFELLEVEALPNLPAPRQFLFKYTILEANTAVKPFLLEHLLDAHDLPNIVYFDPDIWILGSLDALAAEVEASSVVLTPHLTTPIEDDAYPGEQAILQSGAYNLGFVAIRDAPASRRLLRWWQERLDELCVVRVPDGLFVDQKWMDLAPGLFGDVRILDDVGYNVAYWNLHGRSVTVDQAPASLAPETDGGGVSACVGRPGADDDGADPGAGRPLVFFHFSGIQPESLRGVSKHQNRFTLDEIGDAAILYRLYARALLDAGYRETRPWPYAYGRFSNGVAIPDAARSLVLEASPAQRARWGDPFTVDGPSSLFAWMLDAAGGGLSRLLLHLHATRPDLQSAFPDPLGSHRAAYAAWLLDVGRHVLPLDDVFLADLEAPIDEPLALRAKNRLRRIAHSAAGRRAKETLKRALGPRRTDALKTRIRRRLARRRPAAGAPDETPRLESVGLNVFGYLRAETGMGEAGRGMARAAEAAGIPCSLHALELGVVARQDDRSIVSQSDSDEPRHDVNLFVVNADQVEPVRRHLGTEVFAGRRNIGLWLWELPDFPDALRSAFEPFDEIWTPSSFCVDALSAVSPVPVRRVPLPVAVPPLEAVAQSRRRHREALGIDDEALVVVYIFNYLSVFERKNPLAAVRAFRRAFGDDPSKLLLLKTSQSERAPDEHGRLLEAIGDAANIRTIDEYLPRDAVDGLVDLCDVYLSPHRSEGFGLTVAEAMARAKTVIATPWSGVRDFFDLNNGLPLRYALEALTEPVGPYPAGSHWADPEVEHAAELLARVADDPALRQRLGNRARRDVEGRLSVAAVGEVVRRRFDELVRRASDRQPPR